ncbi:MAG: sigma-70 family RNA polymerase sigma factor [Halobacteria archaeon]|nr:sigma-70 family RNA polymerase sigma factor [Halobacteria archaeon]
MDNLYGAALRLTQNSADAEDLVAETVLKAISSSTSLKDRRCFRAWVYRILNNVFISQCRKRNTRAEVSLSEEGSEEDEDFWIFDKLHQPFLLWWDNPEQAFLDQILIEDIDRGLHKLPEDFRVTVVLADVEGFSYQEIADALGIPIGTVRSRLAPGRSLLQKTLWDHACDAGLVAPEVKPGDKESL